MSNPGNPSHPFESPQASDSIVETRQPLDHRPRWVPPLWVRLIAAGLVMTAGIVRWFTITGDHAIVNILTFFCGVLACATLGIWFWLLSDYSRWFRWGVTGLMLTLVVAFFAAMRVEHVSGELVPTFRPRWSQPVDETLRPAVPEESGRIADLARVSQDDFPQFLGPHRSNRVDHVRLEHDWSANPPRQLWKQPIGAGWSAFASVNGFAVTLEQRGPEELVTCYEAATGKLIWSHATPTRHQTIPGGTGPRSTPTIFDGRVYTLGATGELLCLDGASGQVAWRTNLLERYGVIPEEDTQGVAWGRSNSPLIVGDLVVVPAGGPPEGPWVSLAAFRRESGELVWEGGDQQVSYSSPILATLSQAPQIICIHEKSVAGHDPNTGDLLWSHDWPGNSTQDANVSQPVPIGGNRLFLSKGYGRGAALLEVSETSPAGMSVQVIWEDRRLLKTKFTNVVVDQGHLYGLSDGILECVHLDSGKQRWKAGRYGQGQILGVSDVILVQAESGDVAMVAASPDRYRELGRFSALEGKTWNNLCLTGKRLLVRNSEQAACYELP